MARTLHEHQWTLLIISRSVPRMGNVSEKKSCRGNQNTHFMSKNIFFFRKPCPLWDNVEKYCRAGQATDDNMAHAGWLRLQTHAENMQYSLLFNDNGGYRNAPQSYVVGILPVLLFFHNSSAFWLSNQI